MEQFIPNEGGNRLDTASGGHQGLHGQLEGAGRRGWQLGGGGVAARCPIGPEQREGEFGTYPQFDGKTLKFFKQGSDEFVIYLWQGREGAVNRKEKTKRM